MKVTSKDPCGIPRASSAIVAVQTPISPPEVNAKLAFTDSMVSLPSTITLASTSTIAVGSVSTFVTVIVSVPSTLSTAIVGAGPGSSPVRFQASATEIGALPSPSFSIVPPSDAYSTLKEVYDDANALPDSSPSIIGFRSE